MAYSFVKEEIGIQFVIFDAEYFAIVCCFIYDVVCDKCLDDFVHHNVIICISVNGVMHCLEIVLVSFLKETVADSNRECKTVKQSTV
jgi:hypothetical protein